MIADSNISDAQQTVSNSYTLAELSRHPQTRDILAPYAQKYGVDFGQKEFRLPDLLQNMGGGMEHADIMELTERLDELPYPLEPSADNVQAG